MHDLPENPLAPCARATNCIRTTIKFAAPAEDVGRAVDAALQTPYTIETQAVGDFGRSAVFRAFVFKDDVRIQWQAVSSSETVVYIRSASRVGRSDLGVNRKRVRGLIQRMEKLLSLKAVG